MKDADCRPLVVIADDDADDQMMMQEAFRERCPRCRLQFVHNGEELMQLLGGEGSGDLLHRPIPMLLLLDLNMPLKDGRESLIELRTNPAFQTMAIVVMTTSDSEEDRLFCRTHGADAYIVKPSRYRELLDTVAALEPYFSHLTDRPRKPVGYEQ